MEVYNADFTQKMDRSTLDFSKGYLDIVERKIGQRASLSEIKENEDGSVTTITYPSLDITEQVEVFIPYTQVQIKRNEMNDIKFWFDTVYGYQEEKYRRLVALNKTDDDGVSAAEKLNALYLEAEEKRKQIQELEKEIKKLEEL